MSTHNYRHWAFLLLQFWFCTSCFAKDVKLDSLLKILPTLRDSARIDCMELVGIQYSFTNNFDSAIYYYQRIDAESRNINYKHGIALSFYIRASVAYRRDNNLPEAQAFAKESLNWFALSENKKRIEFPYLKIGITLFLEGHTEEAYPYLELSCKWSEQNKNREMLDYSIGFIYEHYRDIGDYVKAFDAFQKVLQISLSFDGKIDTTAQYYMLGELHRRIENYPVALNYYRQCIRRLDLNNSDIWFRTGYPELFALNEKFDSALYYYKQIDTAKLSTIDISFYQVSIGEFFLLKREYRQALGYLLRGLKYTRDEGNKQIDQRRRVLIDIAKSYAGLKEYSNALAYSREGLNMSLQANAKQYIRDAYQILYTIYQDQNEPDSAFIYFKKYIAQKEIVANDVLKGKFAAYNYDQKIDQLNKEKQLQQHQIKQNARQRQFLVAGIIILFVLSVAVFRNILLKRKNEAGLRKIAENELQLQKLESEKARAELQQQATELEMQALRAQMNPHFIFNCLSSINRFILKNESDIASDYLTKFSRLVRMVLNNSQKEAILLEDELEMLRLYLDLERLRFKNAFDYSISFRNNFDAASIYIPPLLLQPFAENAIWHGLMHKDGNGFIEVAFALENNMLNCFITDNGVGRKNADLLKSKSAEKQKSMGMKITSKRLALLNRNMEQTSFQVDDLLDEAGNAAGTRVTLKIQYKDNLRAVPES